MASLLFYRRRNIGQEGDVFFLRLRSYLGAEPLPEHKGFDFCCKDLPVAPASLGKAEKKKAFSTSEQMISVATVLHPWPKEPPNFFPLDYCSPPVLLFDDERKQSR